MLKTLERYQKCSYGVEEVNKPAKELESSYREYLRVKAKFEALQRTQRNLLGEDLGPLNTKDLEQLEHQLESSLNQVRSTKFLPLSPPVICVFDVHADHDVSSMLGRADRTLPYSSAITICCEFTVTQYMLDQLSDLQNKEHLLLEANRALTIKLTWFAFCFHASNVRQLDEISARNNLRPSWEGDDQQNMSYGHHHAQSQGLFQHLECNPTLQIGYNPVGSDQMTGTTHAAQQVHGFIPGWML
ncbi:hypothetical protein DKX38_027150 [Salix brachista]|uniref:K-box domain-containing protein n=1 Tax=Salix brachista TaxID=2182728 RepID=A0A5N5JCB5_9ROSI|nr:hypothetical protein DKX38_027150 [Salix brachista]